MSPLPASMKDWRGEDFVGTFQTIKPHGSLAFGPEAVLCGGSRHRPWGSCPGIDLGPVGPQACICYTITFAQFNHP